MSTVYKRMSIDLRTLADRLHAHFGVCMAEPPPGVYWSGAFTPIITEFGPGYYYLDAKTGDAYPARPIDFATGKLNGVTVFHDRQGIPAVAIPKTARNVRLVGAWPGIPAARSDTWDTAGLIAQTALCEHIRRKVNSPFYPYRTFDVREHLIGNIELAEIAVSDHAWVGVDTSRYLRMLANSSAAVDENARAETLREIGVSVKDEIDIMINRACQAELDLIDEFIGPHIDNLYTYRLVGKTLHIEQGVDHRAREYIDQQEAARLNAPSH